MNGLQAIARSVGAGRRQAQMLTMDDYVSLFGIDSPLFANITALRADVEAPDPAFLGLTSGVIARSGPVYAALMARAKLFSQARFQFQQLYGGRTGALFGTPDLNVLEHPEPGEGTTDLLLRAMLHADLEGDWFGVHRTVGGANRIKALRPDWTTVVLGSKNPDADPHLLGLDPDAEIIGFGYQPGGPASGYDVIAFGREEVAHFHPNANPISRYRGMPLVLAVLREILADSAATSHKLNFFRHGGSPAIAISMPPTWDDTKVKSWIGQYEKKHTGLRGAYRAMYFNAGMKAETVGSNFQQMTFKELQGAAESRIAAATGIHPVLIGFSEGLQGSSLSVGNFAAAARNTADVTMRWLWANLCGSLEVIVPPPAGTRLWYDQKAIPFLQADVKDQAEVMSSNMTTITGYVKEGFTPASAVDTVNSGDITRLIHTGLVSVQLQPPGNELPDGSGGTPGQARTFQSLPISQLEAMVGKGWSAATPADAAVIEAALAWTGSSRMGVVATGAVRATREFWAVDGLLADLGPVRSGDVLRADHPLARAFPALFVSTADEQPVRVSIGSPAPRLTAGPAPIVTADQVHQKRAELTAAGKPAGYDSLAAELGVSRDTIRRRLAGV